MHKFVGLPKHCRVRLGCATATQGVPGRLAACDRGDVKNVWFGVGPTTQTTPFHHSGALEPPGANLELHKFAESTPKPDKVQKRTRFRSLQTLGSHVIKTTL